MPEIAANLVDIYPYRRSAGDRSTTVEFLLLRRRQGTIYEGEWRMVAGKIESGETAYEAAHRELFEETGLVADLLWALPSANVFYEVQTDRIRIAAPFAAEVRGAIRLNEEHDDFRWLAPEVAASNLRWPEQRRLLLLANQELANAIPVSWQTPPRKDY